MRNFLRCLRVAWPYRRRLLLSVACAVFAALFWSVTFLAIHPALKILGSPKSLTESVQADIDEVEKEATQTRDKVAAGTTTPDQVEGKLQRLAFTSYRLRLLMDFYARYLPANRFHALLCLMAAFVAAIAVKGLFEVGQESLVGSVTNLTIYNLRNRFFRSALRLDVNHFR